MYDDWGCPISWLRLPQNALLHMLRASQRRAFLRKIKPKRHDLGFLSSVRQGLDLFASTWLARTKGAAKCTAWQLSLLLNYMAGGDHTQQRRSRSNTSADPSPLCRYCDEEEETQEHTIRDCKCWARERTPLTLLISDEQWSQLPPHTRHCGLFDEDPALLDLQADLARDVLPQPIPRPPP